MYKAKQNEDGTFELFTPITTTDPFTGEQVTMYQDIGAVGLQDLQEQIDDRNARMVAIQSLSTNTQSS